MSHEIETMAFSGEVPWHGRGVNLTNEDQISTARMIAASGLDWTVTQQALYTADGAKAPALANVRASDGSILGVVGIDYSVLQNYEAFDFFQPFLDAGQARLETAGSLRGGKRVWVLARVTAAPLEIVKGDAVEAFIMISNSHDGTMAVRAGFTPIRVVCANTLAAAHGGNRSRLIRVRHQGKVAETLDAVRESMDLVRGEFVATTELYRALASKPLAAGDLERYVRQIFAPKAKPAVDVQEVGALLLDSMLDASGAVLANEDQECKRLTATIERLAAEGRGHDIEGVMGTWWGAYNAVTEFLSYERGRSEDTRLDSLWFGQGANLNRKALQIAASNL